ncbi:PepSY domain-containing protein [Streptomyces sp. PT12]|uniref:PepSY domain-containing protein n=1 Tax=Streptomyces sp. PT12 TaxID=1510197 RepID=UPI0015EE5377|nr:PepSY domain-containing protein [Streptomyces sp. PT12]
MTRNLIIAIVAAGAVIGGGTLAGAAMSSDDQEPASAALDDLNVADAASGDDGADDTGGDDATTDDGGSGSVAEQAVATAVAEVPGVVTEIERDHDDGRRGWEIDVFGDDEQWYKLLVSEDGTEVVNARADDDDDDDDRDDDDGRDGRDDDDGRDDRDDDDDDRTAASSLLADGSRIDAAQAIRLAEEHTSGTLREADVENGHWKLELRTDDGAEREIRISLASGEITDQGHDDDWDDDDDDDDDRDDDDGRDDRDDRDDDDDDDDRDDD